MKFARLLRTTAEDLPELQCLFQLYKHMKKQLKKLPAKSSQFESAGPGPALEPGDDANSSLAASSLSPAASEHTAHLPQLHQQLPASAAAAASLDATPASEPSEPASVPDAQVQQAQEEARFTGELTDHLQRLNDRFLEREELCVIQLERLEAEATALAAAAAEDDSKGSSHDGCGAAGAAVPPGAATGTSHATSQPPGHGHDSMQVNPKTAGQIAEQRSQLYKRFVNFHGEVLLLVHWSVLAYTATVKILKKHHKRTGLLLRAPQLADLLQQPFCSSELMTSLARKAETCIQQLAEQLVVSGTSGEGDTGAVAADAPPGSTSQQHPDGAAPAPPLHRQHHHVHRHGGPGLVPEEEDDDDDTMPDGSSPSCSQSLGDALLAAPPAIAASAHPQQLQQQCHGRVRANSIGGNGICEMATAAEAEAAAAAATAAARALAAAAACMPAADGLAAGQRQQHRISGSMQAAIGGAASGQLAALDRQRRTEAMQRAGVGSSMASLAGPPLVQLAQLEGPVALDEDDSNEQSSAETDSADSGGALPSLQQRQQQRLTPGVGMSAGRTPSAGTTVHGASNASGQQQPPQQQLSGQGQGSRSWPGQRASGTGMTTGGDMQQEQQQQAAYDGGADQQAEAGSSQPQHHHHHEQHQHQQPPGQHPQNLLQRMDSDMDPSTDCTDGIGSNAPSSHLLGMAGPHGTNLLRRTQVALTMWQQLKANASTPSTVIDPARAVKRQRVEEGEGSWAANTDS